jgi:Protein of unknown function (DUF1572)
MQQDALQAFINQSRNLLTCSYLPRIERCVEKLSDQELWWRANPESNSVGNLMLHLAGNMRQWIICGVAGSPDERRRQHEFDERGLVPGREVLLQLKKVLQESDGVLAALLEHRRIQGLDVTVLEAIYSVVSHFSMHTGQIILLTKMWKGDLGFFDMSGGTPRPRFQKRVNKKPAPR